MSWTAAADTLHELGERLRVTRDALGLTQADAIRACFDPARGVMMVPPSVPHWSSWEQGRGVPSHEFAAILDRWVAAHEPVPAHGARVPDQRTSTAAADRHHTDNVRRFSSRSYSARLLHAFARSGDDRSPAGLTDAEATNAVIGRSGSRYWAVSRWEGCRRRCSDLRAAGFIEDSGRERDGRIVWIVTDTGRDAIVKLDETGWSRGKAAR